MGDHSFLKEEFKQVVEERKRDREGKQHWRRVFPPCAYAPCVRSARPPNHRNNVAHHDGFAFQSPTSAQTSSLSYPQSHESTVPRSPFISENAHYNNSVCFVWMTGSMYFLHHNTQSHVNGSLPALEEVSQSPSPWADMVPEFVKKEYSSTLLIKHRHVAPIPNSPPSSSTHSTTERSLFESPSASRHQLQSHHTSSVDISIMTFDEQLAYIHNAGKADDSNLLVSSMRYLENPLYYQEKFRHQLQLQSNKKCCDSNSKFDLSRALTSALYCNWIEITNISRRSSRCNSGSNTPASSPTRKNKKINSPNSLIEEKETTDDTTVSAMRLFPAEGSSPEKHSQHFDVSGNSDPDYSDAIDWKGMDPANSSASFCDEASFVTKSRTSMKSATAINSLIIPSPLSLPAKHSAVQALSTNPIKLKMIHSSSAALATAFYHTNEVQTILKNSLGQCKFVLVELGEEYVSASVLIIDAIIKGNAELVKAKDTENAPSPYNLVSIESILPKTPKRVRWTDEPKPASPLRPTSATNTPSKASQPQSNKKSAVSPSILVGSAAKKSVEEQIAYPQEPLPIASVSIRVESCEGDMSFGLQEFDEQLIIDWIATLTHVAKQSGWQQQRQSHIHYIDGNEGYESWLKVPLYVRQRCMFLFKLYRKACDVHMSQRLSSSSTMLSGSNHGNNKVGKVLASMDQKRKADNFLSSDVRKKLDACLKSKKIVTKEQQEEVLKILTEQTHDYDRLLILHHCLFLYCGPHLLTVTRAIMQQSFRVFEQLMDQYGEDVIVLDGISIGVGVYGSDKASHSHNNKVKGELVQIVIASEFDQHLPRSLLQNQNQKKSRKQRSNNLNDVSNDNSVADTSNCQPLQDQALLDINVSLSSQDVSNGKPSTTHHLDTTSSSTSAQRTLPDYHRKSLKKVLSMMIHGATKRYADEQYRVGHASYPNPYLPIEQYDALLLWQESSTDLGLSSVCNYLHNMFAVSSSQRDQLKPSTISKYCQLCTKHRGVNGKTAEDSVFILPPGSLDFGAEVIAMQSSMTISEVKTPLLNGAMWSDNNEDHDHRHNSSSVPFTIIERGNLSSSLGKIGLCLGRVEREKLEELNTNPRLQQQVFDALGLEDIVWLNSEENMVVNPVVIDPDGEAEDVMRLADDSDLSLLTTSSMADLNKSIETSFDESKKKSGDRRFVMRDEVHVLLHKEMIPSKKSSSPDEVVSKLSDDQGVMTVLACELVRPFCKATNRKKVTNKSNDSRLWFSHHSRRSTKDHLKDIEFPRLFIHDGDRQEHTAQCFYELLPNSYTDRCLLGYSKYEASVDCNNNRDSSSIPEEKQKEWIVAIVWKKQELTDEDTGEIVVPVARMYRDARILGSLCLPSIGSLHPHASWLPLLCSLELDRGHILTASLRVPFIAAPPLSPTTGCTEQIDVAEFLQQELIDKKFDADVFQTIQSRKPSLSHYSNKSKDASINGEDLDADDEGPEDEHNRIIKTWDTFFIGDTANAIPPERAMSFIRQVLVIVGLILILFIRNYERFEVKWLSTTPHEHQSGPADITPHNDVSNMIALTSTISPSKMRHDNINRLFVEGEKNQIDQEYLKNVASEIQSSQSQRGGNDDGFGAVVVGVDGLVQFVSVIAPTNNVDTFFLDEEPVVEKLINHQESPSPPLVPPLDEKEHLEKPLSNDSECEQPSAEVLAPSQLSDMEVLSGDIAHDEGHLVTSSVPSDTVATDIPSSAVVIRSRNKLATFAARFRDNLRKIFNSVFKNFGKFFGKRKDVLL